MLKDGASHMSLINCTEDLVAWVVYVDDVEGFWGSRVLDHLIC
jgi:hypothetical protein